MVYYSINKMFKLIECENNVYRSNLFTEQDIFKWISEYSNETNTSWIMNNKSAFNECSKFVCR